MPSTRRAHAARIEVRQLVEALWLPQVGGEAANRRA
jgi:hypothetical protein